jgi:hypothetical protein
VVEMIGLGWVVPRIQAGASVRLRTAKAAIRRSDLSLTANVYTDTNILDVAGQVAMAGR